MKYRRRGWRKPDRSWQQNCQPHVISSYMYFFADIYIVCYRSTIKKLRARNQSMQRTHVHIRVATPESQNHHACTTARPIPNITHTSTTMRDGLVLISSFVRYMRFQAGAIITLRLRFRHASAIFFYC